MAITHERFQIRDMPGTDGKILSSHKTREEADVALSEAQAKGPGSFVITDTGAPIEVTKEEEARLANAEAVKTAAQKAQDQADAEAKSPQA